MTPTRWQEIERVYHASLERPPAERAAFLAEVRKQSKDNWRAQYTAKAVVSYIETGFNLGLDPR